MQDFYASDLFSLALNQTPGKAKINMRMLIPLVNTRFLPQTMGFLKKENPSVLESQCFNDEHLPFFQEVRATELGHLFEHLLLDQLCLLKVDNGAYCAVYSGRTHWNWQKDPRGLFRIEINIGKKELPLLLLALKRTIVLMEKLLRHTNLRIVFK